MAGALITTGKDDYNTPEKYLDEVRAFYGGRIDLDPCSNAGSKVAATTNVILPDNGLLYNWDGKRVFVNPPFDVKTTLEFWEKARSSSPDTEVIFMIPLKAETVLWQERVFNEASAICFLRSRVRFLGGKSSNLQPIAFVYLGPRAEDFVSHFCRLGACVDCGDLVTPADLQVH